LKQKGRNESKKGNRQEMREGRRFLPGRKERTAMIAELMQERKQARWQNPLLKMERPD
jgi:hypothetical protein